MIAGHPMEQGPALLAQQVEAVDQHATARPENAHPLADVPEALPLGQVHEDHRAVHEVDGFRRIGERS